MSDFVHLHTHSHYSLLNALPKIPDLVGAAAEYGMDALALTDDGNLYAAVEFYKTAIKNDIKPIIGVDFYVASRKRTDKVSGIDNRRFRLVLLAKNNQGYKNLLKLVSTSNVDGFYYKPRIDRELLSEYGSDLIAIMPQFSGEVAQALRLNDTNRADEALDFYHKLFGDDLYFEILHNPEIEGQSELREKIIAYGKEKNIPLVATGDTYYLKPEDKKARDILTDVANVKSGGGFHREEDDFAFYDGKTMAGYFSDTPEAITNTRKIADLCNVELTLGAWTFPNFPLPDGQNADDVLRERVLKARKDRNYPWNDEVEKRINYELDVIKTKGYSVYFLVVADLIRHAKENDIYTNTRGSAAGSLVSYLFNITTVDPIKYKLPFERFLNPERPSPPDVDLDIAEDKRDELIAYAKEKYGEDAVAQIGTFGTMAARGAVRDVARAMGYEYSVGDRISKLIPMGKQGFPMFIARALDEEPELKKLYDTDADAKKIIDMAQKIEGCARHISVHAAGVVISPTRVDDYTPIQVDQKSGKHVTQFSMYPVEEVGLLKYDFLGLKNLTVLYEAVRRIRKTRGEDVDVYDLPLDNKKTYAMLAKGHTEGVFQLSSDGMTKWIKELRPTNIEDINAMVALYRPGPMDFIPEYIKRKRNPGLVTYPHPQTEPYLRGSLGLLIYQDDIMQLAVDMASYSWLEADVLRKAMGKKIPELMAKEEDHFKKGCLASGLDEKLVNTLWDNIVTFAAYGFNKGHAAAYGRLSYMTAYLKANYPAEYMAAVMSADAGDNPRIAKAVHECDKLGIPVLPPDVNESFEDFGVVVSPDGDHSKDEIRFGLKTIKNFGENISRDVVEERKKNGKFTSLEDFLVRMKHSGLNKKSLEALALSGAFDSLEKRSVILGNIDVLLQFIKEERSVNAAQDSLFATNDDVALLTLKDRTGETIRIKTGMNEELTYTLPMTRRDELFWEKELLGLYVSGHPLDKYKKLLSGEGKNIASVIARGYTVGTTLAGVVEELKPITTKKGKRMAFMRISDFTGEMEVVVFPDLYSEYQDLLAGDKVLAISGKLSKKDEVMNLIADKIKVLS